MQNNNSTKYALSKLFLEVSFKIEKLKERTKEQVDIVKEITIEPQTIYQRIYNSSSIADKTNLL